ncbi:MAG: hypothetical protein Q7U74_10395, partial [Saprospiraceae bacterium]|nr:hypothetical protein [Saprospiraceae bacterium]
LGSDGFDAESSQSGDAKVKAHGAGESNHAGSHPSRDPGFGPQSSRTDAPAGKRAGGQQDSAATRDHSLGQQSSRADATGRKQAGGQANKSSTDFRAKVESSLGGELGNPDDFRQKIENSDLLGSNTDMTGLSGSAVRNGGHLLYDNTVVPAEQNINSVRSKMTAKVDEISEGVSSMKNLVIDSTIKTAQEKVTDGVDFVENLAGRVMGDTDGKPKKSSNISDNDLPPIK